MRTCLIALFLLLSLVAAPTVRASVPWERLPGVNLTEADNGLRGKAIEIMKAENCYYECPDTVYSCVTKATPAMTALRMAGVIVRLLVDGKTPDDISAELRNRAKSAHPFKKANIDTSGMPRVGPEGSSVTVVIYADFDCPYCRVVSPRLIKLQHSLGDQVSIVFKLFPVKAHGPQSVVTSKAGWAAQLQGCFWAFHDVMYANFDDHDDDDIVRLANKAGCDLGPFKTAWNAKDTKEKLRTLKREGVKLGVKSTPSIFVNGKRYHGLKTAAELRDRLEEELDLVGR